AVETTQRDILAAYQALRHHAEQPSGPVAAAPDAFGAFATIVVARCQSGPGGKVFFSRPGAQVGTHLTDELQHAVGRQRGQLRQIPSATHLGQYLAQPGNFWGVDAAPSGGPG